MKPGTLSVIMPNYNHSKFIGEALNAILGQSLQPKEVIVIDDCSTDDSVRIIRQFAGRYPIIRYYQNNENMGCVPTVNRGIGLATGDFVTFSAADDIALPGMFEKSMTLLSRYPDAGICSSLSLEMDNESKNRGLCKSPVISSRECYISPREARGVLMKYGEWITGGTSVYRRQALLEIGGLRPELQPYSDAFAMLLLTLKFGACFIPEILGAWRYLGENITFSMYYGNPDAFFSVTGRAKELMLSQYAEFFHPELITMWEKMQRYSFYRLHFIAPQKEQIRRLAEDLPPGTVWEEFLWQVLRVSMAASRFASRLYLAAFFNMLRVPLIREHFFHYFRNRQALKYEIQVNRFAPEPEKER